MTVLFHFSSRCPARLPASRTSDRSAANRFQVIHTELGALLEDKIHGLASDQGLYQPHSVGFRRTFPLFLNRKHDAACTNSLNRTDRLPSTTVEHEHVVTDSGSQDVDQMAALSTVEFDPLNGTGKRHCQETSMAHNSATP